MSEASISTAPSWRGPRPRRSRRASAVPSLLDAPGDPVRVAAYPRSTPGRERIEGLVHDVYRRAYGARVEAFYPLLLAFEHAAGAHAVIGLRDAREHRLFSECYLDAPVQDVATERLRAAVDREGIVELGNLAATGPGQARWLIAALTAYLHAAGYRWALFTLVPALHNAFHRMGLSVLDLGAADAARLADGGASWGSYYARGPRVCLGDVAVGFRTLSLALVDSSPGTRRLWRDAAFAGASARQSRLDPVVAISA